MYRVELKYFINPHQRYLMLNKLCRICERDPFCSVHGGYLVSSLYYDDYKQSAFFDKLNGVRDRKKFRIRIYDHQPDVIKLERKIKRESATQKTHLQISMDEYENLINGDTGFLREKRDSVADDFYLNYQTRYLRPRVVVEYHREAFIYRYGDVRITIDTLLKAGVFQKDLFSDGYMVSTLPWDQIILEVKFTGYIPGFLQNTIRLFNLQRQSISKFAMCCAAGM